MKNYLKMKEWKFFVNIYFFVEEFLATFNRSILSIYEYVDYYSIGKFS